MMVNIAGVYVHVPYCLEKCGYCAFNSRPLPDAAALERYLDAVELELSRWSGLLAGSKLSTIYFGGGTPTLAAPERIGRLIERLIDATQGAAMIEEITIEANPATLDERHIEGLLDAGVNRLSIGVQSFDPAALDFMECGYRVDHIDAAYAAARRAGFTNVGLDLIVGLPKPFDGTYAADLERALALSPEHLSVYLLTVEAPSRLYERVKAGHVKPLDGDRQADIFLACHQRLTAAGYEHYEVSNFAKPGYRSRHNGLYWTGEYYWGLGAGAHTYLPHAGRPVRRANLANPERYIAALNTGEPPVEFTEKLSPSMMQREKIMLALRTVDGLAPMEFGELEDKMIRTLTPHARHGRYSWDGRRFRPTPAGLLLADGVATELWELFAE